MGESPPVRTTLGRANPLDAFDTLQDAREGLEHLERLRAASMPLVLLGIVFAAGITWLDAQLVVWGAEPLLTQSPFNLVLLSIWAFNAFAGVQFLLLARKAWVLQAALNRYYAALPARIDEDRREAA